MAEAKKQEKEGFFRRTGKRISKWFREMRAELKKVVWPTKKQVLQNTVVVLISVLVIGRLHLDLRRHQQSDRSVAHRPL